jgi:hypothetical protein
MRFRAAGERLEFKHPLADARGSVCGSPSMVPIRSQLHYAQGRNTEKVEPMPTSL